MNSTGVEDKNGKEICEGDLLGLIFSNGKYHASALVKVINESYFILTSYNDYNSEYRAELIYNTHLEIIGSVYDELIHP